MAKENYQGRGAWATIVRKVHSSPTGRVAGGVIRDLLHREGHVAWGTLKSTTQGKHPRCLDTKNSDGIFFTVPITPNECKGCILQFSNGSSCSVGVNFRKDAGVDTAPDALSAGYTPASSLTTGRMRGSKIG